MPDRTGIGKHPEGCTCILNHWFGEDGYEHWAVYITGTDCPWHGDRTVVRLAEEDVKN